MKKKLIFTLVIFLLFVWVGIKGYQVAHSHAQSALSHVQNRLQKLVGAKGKYSYSEAHISWLTQSVVVHDVKLSFSDKQTLTIQTVRVTPRDKDSVSNLNMENIDYKSPSITATIASLAFNDLMFPNFAKDNGKTGFSLSDIKNISFEEGNLKGAYFYSHWGKFRIGSWRISRVGSVKRRPYIFNNVDLAPAIRPGQTPSWDAVHFDQLVWEMSNDQQFNDKEVLSALLTSNNFYLKVFGMVGYRDFKKRLSMGQMNIHLTRQAETWDGEILGDKVDYDLLSSYSLFAEYLKRLGYSHINGAFHTNFTYYIKDSFISLHKLNYFGNDFIGLNLQSLFYIDRKVLNLYMLNWPESVSLKSMTLSAYDTGLKKRIISILAQTSGKPEGKVYDETLKRFIEFSKGKDFDLDRQLYTSLADIMQNPKHVMKISIMFNTPERVNYLLNMNFIDFFKLINQNNLTITAASKK